MASSFNSYTPKQQPGNTTVGYYPKEYLSNMSGDFVIGWHAGYEAAMKEMATRTITTGGSFTMPKGCEQHGDNHGSV